MSETEVPFQPGDKVRANRTTAAWTVTRCRWRNTPRAEWWAEVERMNHGEPVRWGFRSCRLSLVEPVATNPAGETFHDYVARRMAEAAKRGNPFGAADRPVPVEAEKPELPRECFRAMRRNNGLAKMGPLAIATVMIAIGAASAHEPGEPYAAWYESLTRPGGGSCCSLSDGRTTEVRVTGDHYEAWIDQRFPDGDGVGWVTVKPEAVLQRVDNPTGEPVVFWRKTMGVLCLVRPMET